jgi:hypothetical protein
MDSTERRKTRQRLRFQTTKTREPSPAGSTRNLPTTRRRSCLVPRPFLKTAQLHADTYSIQCWIRSHKPIIYQSRREAKRHSVTNVRLLPTYFHPLPSRRTRQEKHTCPTRSTQPQLRSTRIPRPLQPHTLHSRSHSKINPPKPNSHSPLPEAPAIKNLTFSVGLPYSLRRRRDSHITESYIIFYLIVASHLMASRSRLVVASC